MKKLEYQVRFNTAAFLGNAEQSGQWRTPPFKALLRQWWRVAYAADHDFRVDVAGMRAEEGVLFGNAWLEGDFRKSLMRIRLDRWDEGKLRSWQGLEQSAVHHPETERTGYKVGPHAYLGYGPLDGRGNTQLDRKRNAAIQAGESATLSVAVPATHKDAGIRQLLEANVPRIERALWLMDRYGTLGGRSRNGWGSFALTPINGTPALTGQVPARDWKLCLGSDWPHAIGRDDKGMLIWQTAPHDDWKALMKTLAVVKIGLRTQKPHLEFVLDANAGDKATRNGINHGRPQGRHWLSYPVTNHPVKAWGNNARLPNTLRFKIRQDDNGKLVGVIFHVPHLPPLSFNPDKEAIEKVWQRVHAFIDAPAQRLVRIPE